MYKNWDDLATVKKAKIGERILTEWAEKQGYVVYVPKKGPHAIDAIIMRAKKLIAYVDAKCKPRRKYYPDTGLDVNDYEAYRELQAKHNVPVFLLFVDEIQGEAYGNFIDELDKERYVLARNSYILYPRQESAPAIRYFPLEAMIKLAKLSADDICILKGYTKSNYDYAEFEIGEKG